MNKILRAGVDFAGNIAQLILQARMRPNPIFLFRIEQIHRNLQQMEQENNLSTDFLFFLVQRDYYCSRTKFSRFTKTNINLPVSITLNFDLIHKQNSFSRTAEIWKIILQKKACPQCTEHDCLRDIVHLSKQVLDQIKSESIFSDLIGNREAEEKYFIDYRFDMNVGVGDQDQKKDFTGLLWNSHSRVNEEYEIEVQCHFNKRQYFGIRSSLRRISRGLRKSTEDTKDSYSLESIKDASLLKRFRSYQEKLQAYQIYDKELQITIISSDSDSLSNSRQKLQPFTLGESEQFELLYDQSNQDQTFLVDNQALIDSWSKLISFK